MTGHLSLITTLVTAFGLALVFGYLAEKFLKTPALVGFLIAGVAVSMIPGLPEVDVSITQQLADVGVMLLMFGVGLHFSVRNLLKVKSVSVPGALAQMLTSGALGTIFALSVWDWSLPSAIVFGLSLSCASTVVVTKALEMRRETTTMNGQATIGWLIVQDLVTVVIMVLLPPTAEILVKGENLDAADIALQVATTLAGVAVFVAVMLVAGRKVFPWILRKVALTGSRELFTLAVLGIALGIAYGAGAIFHVSYALGAFFAGVVLQESRYAHRAATNSLPLQDAFAVLFFVSVGLMLDWRIFIERPLEVITVVLIIIAVTSTASFALVVLLKWPLKTALVLAASVAEIGEFSYILAAQGISLGMADADTMSLIVAASIISIAINPVFFKLIPKVQEALIVKYRWARKAADRQPPYSELPKATPREMRFGQIIIAGYNELVPALIATFKETNRRVILICSSSDPIDELEKKEIGVIVGDPSDPMVLVQAHVASAAALVLPLGDSILSRKTLDAARALNNSIKIVARAATNEDAQLFSGAHGDDVTILSDPITTSYALASRTIEILDMAPKRTGSDQDYGPIAEDDDGRSVDARKIYEREYRKIVESIRGRGEAPEAVAPQTPEAMEEALELSRKEKEENEDAVKATSAERPTKSSAAAFAAGLWKRAKSIKFTTFTSLDAKDSDEQGEKHN